MAVKWTKSSVCPREGCHSGFTDIFSKKKIQKNFLKPAAGVPKMGLVTRKITVIKRAYVF